MARPLKGAEIREQVTIRLQPSEKELLTKLHGGVQASIDLWIKQLQENNSKKNLKADKDGYCNYCGSSEGEACDCMRI